MNIDPPKCFRMQLAQIPGISAKLAQNIAAAHASWPVLLDALRQGGPAVLEAIPLVGKKKAAQIAGFILQT